MIFYLSKIYSNHFCHYRIIVHFKTEEAKDFKVNWKEVENAVKKEFPKLKIPYSRADPFEGDLAISSYRLNQEQLEELGKAKLEI